MHSVKRYFLRAKKLNQRRVRWGWLGLFSAPLVGAILYNHGWRLPFACPVRHLTGIPCPTCGMTRSFMAIAEGNWQQAISMHLFGPILFLACLVTVLHVGLELATNQRIGGWHLRLISDRWIQLFGLVFYAGYYGLRLQQLSVSGELALSFANSPLGRLLANV
ncbi:MAG: DUF2752 domain-containing protein [Aphanocapsa sp. GSE-SYN-MK-11-07L]|nr:DUF2752 domain-containing protein [Aphanocapsa sp. GSE-SYN-MK-11-07L]